VKSPIISNVNEKTTGRYETIPAVISDIVIHRSWVHVLAGHNCVVAMGKLLTPLSPGSKIGTGQRLVIFLAGKITAGLVESNGSLPKTEQNYHDMM